MNWKTISKWLILIVLAAYAVGAALWANAEAQKEKCTGIEVEILGEATVDSVTSNGVTAELKRFYPTLVGMPLCDIDTRKIQRHLNAMSTFEEVECVITSQGKLKVCVKPMVPVLRVFTGNISYYINKDGKPIRARADFFTDVPIATGKFTRDFPASYLIPVAQFIERDTLMKNLVTMIEANDKNNIILTPRITGHVINIGDTTDLPRKRQMIVTAYKKILPYRGWETYDTISVKFRGQIVATRRNKTVFHSAAVGGTEEDPEEATLEGLIDGNSVGANAPMPKKTTTDDGSKKKETVKNPTKKEEQPSPTPVN